MSEKVNRTEKESPFLVGDIVTGGYYDFECLTGVVPGDCPTGANCITCPIRTKIDAQETILIGSINYVGSDTSSGYLITTHRINYGRPYLNYRFDDGILKYDRVPPVKVGSMTPPVYYSEKFKGISHGAKLRVVFPDYVSEEMISKAKKIETENPIPYWIKIRNNRYMRNNL